jgi:hypothetical protein
MSRDKKMSEENNKSQKEEQPKRFNQQQYDMLKRCSEKKDMTEWNEYRKEHLYEKIWLQGAELTLAHLEHANLGKAHLERANLACAKLSCAHLHEANLKGANLDMANLQSSFLQGANLQGVFIPLAHLEGADLIRVNLQDAHLAGANLQGAILREANLEGANFEMAIVNGSTLLSYCEVNRHTDFRGVGLDSCRIDSGTKQLLKYNIRRMNWEEWYMGHWFWRWPVRAFWALSDYGGSSARIIAWFFGFAFGFACIYYVWGTIAPPGIVDYLFVDGNGVKVAWWLVPIRAIHFSVVIMTVGFTNMHANAHSMWAHILVSLQMILGFVLLGALVTRFAVLFTAGGPAGKFADENKKEDADNDNDEVS